MINTKDIQTEQAILTAGWLMLKKHYNLTQADDWTEAIADYEAVFNMGETDYQKEFAHRYAAVILKYLEDISKTRKT